MWYFVCFCEFCRFTWISWLRDCVKYRKPWAASDQSIGSSKFSFKSLCEEIKSQSLEESSTKKLSENWGIVHVKQTRSHHSGSSSAVFWSFLYNAEQNEQGTPFWNPLMALAQRAHIVLEEWCGLPSGPGLPLDMKFLATCLFRDFAKILYLESL